jgi:hypothetical protein
MSKKKFFKRRKTMKNDNSLSPCHIPRSSSISERRTNLADGDLVQNERSTSFKGKKINNYKKTTCSFFSSIMSLKYFWPLLWVYGRLSGRSFRVSSLEDFFFLFRNFWIKLQLNFWLTQKNPFQKYLVMLPYRL